MKTALLPSWRQTLCRFAVGAVGYCALETLWRGRTHPSMALCGGTVLTLFPRLIQKSASRLSLCLRGCALITGCELACGLWVNRDHSVWNYTGMPGNWKGQICPAYSALWFLLCLPLKKLCLLLERHITLLDKGGRKGL